MTQTNRRLGYPAGTRLLLINADDLGMCHSVNEAIFRTLKAGLVRSTTLMVPCPWALQAIRFLADQPEIPFGVHLTVICDSVDYRWRPLTSREKVPSLVDEAGYFYNFDRMPEFLAQARLDQLEIEFRAQIEAVLAAGLRPTHLDWHALRIGGGRGDIFEVMLKLAREYGLALRVAGSSRIEYVQGQGLPCNDDDFLDSYLLDPAGKTARYLQLLRRLPPGLTEWAVHPGLATAELMALDPGAHFRQADFDFLMLPEAQQVVRQEGIVLLDYRPLQAAWRGG